MNNAGSPGRVELNCRVPILLDGNNTALTTTWYHTTSTSPIPQGTIEMDMDRNDWFDRYNAYIFDRDRKFSPWDWDREFTLSASVEADQKPVQVLKQRSYTGRMPVIPSALADILCFDLGMQGMLGNLNTFLGTSYTLRTSWVYSILGDCILQKWDFGTAYAYLRPYWHDGLTAIVDDLPKYKMDDERMRRDVLVNDEILSPFVPPRRVWDLCSNRVVPWWVVRRQPFGISHAWMAEEDREDIMTPINGSEWPVPVPKGISLDHVRIELLNLGVEYAWLDVLCLRQKGGIGEDLREEEWKTDVPTIGWVYSSTTVVCYLSGLGQPLSPDADDMENDRCWFKRAWTLQEITPEAIIGGDTGNAQLLEKFQEKLSSLGRPEHFFDALSEMRKWVSTNPVDKIAGMVYLLGLDSIPAYYGGMSEEDAWMALLDEVVEWTRTQLFFWYPNPGPTSWHPSWRQVMSEVLPLRWLTSWRYLSSQTVVHTGIMTESCFGGIIESALVQELSKQDSQGEERHGMLIVAGEIGTQHTLEIVTWHQTLIPDGSYTLLGDHEMQYWVIGQSLADQRFKKLSVFELSVNDLLSMSWRIAVTFHRIDLA